MQCPACQLDAVAGAVFCNHCGTLLPAVCGDCNAANPPESRFCHRCGAALAPASAALYPPAPRQREPGMRDIGADLQTLSVDVAAYSAPRIKKGAIFVGRHTGAFAAYSASRIKSLAQRLKPYRAEPPALPAPLAMPTSHVGDDPAGRGQPAAAAIACPRCHNISEPGSLFCFSCGLPLDDAAAAVERAPGAAGAPAGFWIRLGAWLIDLVILLTVQMGIIAIWPGFSEYFASDEDAGLHWVDLLLFILTALYYTVGVAIWATTAGKRLVGLYVLRPDGAQVGLGRALARYFAGILSWLIFGIGYLVIVFRSDKRGLHDLICDTVVVRK